MGRRKETQGPVPPVHRERKPHSVRAARAGAETGCQISDEEFREGRIPGETRAGAARAVPGREGPGLLSEKGREQGFLVQTTLGERGLVMARHSGMGLPPRLRGLRRSEERGPRAQAIRPIYEFAKRRVRRSVPDGPPVTAFLIALREHKDGHIDARRLKLRRKTSEREVLAKDLPKLRHSPSRPLPLPPYSPSRPLSFCRIDTHSMLAISAVPPRVRGHGK